MVFETKPFTPRSATRRTEYSDTRQAIGRHEPDQRRGRSKNDDDAAQSVLARSDEAEISIESLRIFLENFRRSERESHHTANPRGALQPAAPVPVAAPQAGPYDAARAAQAYQATTRTTQPTWQAAPNFGEHTQDPPPNDREDLKTVDRMLTDLHILATAGAQTLYIQRAENFLDSLLQSIAAEKARLNL